MEFSATQFPELVDEELMAEPAEVGISAERQPEDSEPFQQPASPSGRRPPDAVSPVEPATPSGASMISEELHEFKGEVSMIW